VTTSIASAPEESLDRRRSRRVGEPDDSPQRRDHRDRGRPPRADHPCQRHARGERWIDVYLELSAERPGLAGAATARAEAHTVRLAVIYALLDLSEQICPEHLEAALAVWQRPAGLTRTDVSDMFSRNKKRCEIERALGVLQDAGHLRRETRQPERGRAAEVWIPVLAPAV
jgi:hypothetical protein